MEGRAGTICAAPSAASCEMKARGNSAGAHGTIWGGREVGRALHLLVCLPALRDVLVGVRPVKGIAREAANAVPRRVALCRSETLCPSQACDAIVDADVAEARYIAVGCGGCVRGAAAWLPSAERTAPPAQRHHRARTLMPLLMRPPPLEYIALLGPLSKKEQRRGRRRHRSGENVNQLQSGSQR